MFKIIDLNKKFWQWLTLFLLAFIWGTSFILMKRGLQSYTSTQVAAFRMFFAFVFFIPVIISRIKNLKKEHLKSLLIIGFIGNFFPAFLFTKAQTEITSALAGMLNTTTPVFVLLVGLFFYKSRPTKLNIAGVLIGLIGALGLIIKDFNFLHSGISILALLIILATLFYGINTNEIKYKLKDLDGISIAAFSFLFIGPCGGIVLLTSDFSSAITTPNYIHNLINIIILALFSSVLAVVIFNLLIKKTTAIFAASVTYIIPFFAIFWGFFDGEKITLMQIISISVVILGVYLVNKKTITKISSENNI
jgi:drug/metabolite transporter (DMT)-like permease